ncbi:MAG: hypothetical protein OEU36_25945, partial [Gammaproteobacteria bacterium]|nr:hypothetical protein [Gammaproteobacteria bacterium]
MNVPSAAGRQKLYLLLALLLSGNILLFYALPAKIFITIFLFLAITYFFIGGSNALLVTSALVASTIFVEAALQITPLGDSLYYRPHERFAIKDKDLKHGRYKANVDYEGLMPHGDLRALAVHTNVESEPREVVFQTDSWGFRNYEDYNGQPYVLVGDSFIVGNGTTQGETLAEQLRSRYAIDVYNLAHPGSVRDYAKYIRTFRKRLSDEPGVILFLFEGNDFPTPNAPQTKTAPTQRHWPSRVPGGWRLVAAGKWYLAPFKTTTTYKFAYSLISRVTRVEERVDVFPVRDIT